MIIKELKTKGGKEREEMEKLLNEIRAQVEIERRIRVGR